MENYLMSSPRNQQLDYDYQNLDLTLDYYEIKDQNELTDFQNYYDSFPHDNGYGNDDMYKLQNSKNISLTDNMNLTRHHQSNLSITSAQDFLPSKEPKRTMHSHSSSQIHLPHSVSADSIPPLTSSISTQSLASPNPYRGIDSQPQHQPQQYVQMQHQQLNMHTLSGSEPVTDMSHIQFPSLDKTDASSSNTSIQPSPQVPSMGPPTTNSATSNSANNVGGSGSNSSHSTPNPNSAQYQLQQAQPPQSNHIPQHQVLATPRKTVRKKSLSIGSYNFSTPMRSNTSPSTASATSMNVIKISKTPYKHSRSLSRTKNGAGQVANGMNPFYNTPNSFVSPKYDLSFDKEDFQTPLQASDVSQFQNSQQNNGSNSNSNSSSNNPSFVNVPNFNLQFTSPQMNYKVSPTLRRQNTLDSIKIEDQDDDAFKQLKRAKSFNSLKNASPSNEYASYPSSSGQHQHFPTSQSHQDLHPQTHEQEVSLSPHVLMETVPSQQQPSMEPHPSANIQLLQSQFNSLKSYPASVNLASIASDKASGLLPPMTSFSAPASATTSISEPSSNSVSAPSSAGTSVFAASGSMLNLTQFQHQKEALSQAQRPKSSSFQQQSVQSPLQVSEESLKIAKELNPAFVPDLPIKINEKAGEVNDPKKKHACPLCFTRFQRPEHVKRHMKSHSSEKPFECDQPNCNKRFNRKDNLKAHLKKIHNIF